MNHQPKQAPMPSGIHLGAAVQVSEDKSSVVIVAEVGLEGRLVQRSIIVIPRDNVDQFRMALDGAIAALRGLDLPEPPRIVVPS